MKIGLYSPYLHSLSGGEKYMLTLASHWSKSHDVTVFWDDPAILRQATARFDIDLSRVRTVENVFWTRNIFKKMIVSRSFDLLFFLSDGSIPTTFARYNILHFQVPFQHIPVHSIKLGRYQAIVCNSEFTKRTITARLGKRTVVIYPPVAPVEHTRTEKKNIILSVGRLHPLKKQDVLIEAFRKGVKDTLKDFTLIIAGGVLPADEAYLKRLKTAVKNLPIQIVPNASFEKLTIFYNQASIFWHAAGYRETKPENMEHFGIATVEAMSAGVIPVVYNGGGQPEIVRGGEDGYLWANTQDLLKQTSKVITSKTLQQSLSKSAIVRSRRFSKEKFTQSFDRLLIDVTG